MTCEVIKFLHFSLQWVFARMKNARKHLMYNYRRLDSNQRHPAPQAGALTN